AHRRQLRYLRRGKNRGHGPSALLRAGWDRDRPEEWHHSPRNRDLGEGGLFFRRRPCASQRAREILPMKALVHFYDTRRGKALCGAALEEDRAEDSTSDEIL